MKLAPIGSATAMSLIAAVLSLATPSASFAAAASGQESPAQLSRSDSIHQDAQLAMRGRLKVGPTGNEVEMVDPGQSTYIPDVPDASARDRARAQRLLDGANRFCRTHTVAGIKSRWPRGSAKTSHPTHFFNPNRRSLGLHPRRPRAALIYRGELGGMMFTGRPLPYLGTIPRAHTHSGMAMNVEMVHVYCVRSLTKAFTPDPRLGLLAGLIALRKEMRPAVMDLHRAQLHHVRAMARAYAGNRLKHVRPVRGGSGRGPKPVLQAMRREIRGSLMVLSQPQLRRVWRTMQSYGAK